MNADTHFGWTLACKTSRSIHWRNQGRKNRQWQVFGAISDCTYGYNSLWNILIQQRLVDEICNTVNCTQTFSHSKICFLSYLFLPTGELSGEQYKKQLINSLCASRWSNTIAQSWKKKNEFNIICSSDQPCASTCEATMAIWFNHLKRVKTFTNEV